MLLESFRFEDEDEIYLEVFLASILKNYTPPESLLFYSPADTVDSR